MIFATGVHAPPLPPTSIKLKAYKDYMHLYNVGPQCTLELTLRDCQSLIGKYLTANIHIEGYWIIQ